MTTPSPGGWTARGEALVVGDAAGGVYAFDGRSGKTLWAQRAESMKAGVLALRGPPEPTGVRHGRPGRPSPGLGCGRGSDQRVRRCRERLGGERGVVTGRRNGLAASCSRQVHAYAADGARIWRSDDHPSTVSARSRGPRHGGVGDGPVYGRVAFFHASTGRLRQKLEWIGSLVSMVLSPDGDIVACGSQDNSVHFWRRSTEQDSMMSGYPGKPSALAFDDTGTLLATGGGEAVTVWSFHGSGPEGTRPGVLEHHVEAVTTLAFARRGMRLASGARDGGVVVWSLGRDGQGDPIGVAPLEDLVGALYWRPDGRALAALDAQGGATVWRVGDR